MIEFIALVLIVSLILYSIFGGADFGGGILEIFKGPKKSQEQVALITKAMGPVWEANHMWLIISIVVIFNGFPKVFSVISTIYHIPLTVMLVGIILRGCAFTFRHYDARVDGSQKVYSFIFALSSFFTPFMMGVIAGSFLLGEVTGLQEVSFWEVYVKPWGNFFCISVGLLTCSLFVLQAAAFLVAEAEDDRELVEIFSKRALFALDCSILSGILVFIAAYERGFHLFEIVYSRPLALTPFLLATFLLLPMVKSLKHYSKNSRVYAVLQMIFVLVGYFAMMYPNFLNGAETAGFGQLDIYQSAASTATQYYLTWALVLGLLIIVPLLGYLMYIFKLKSEKRN